MAKNEQFSMVQDDTVFEWVKDYFIHYELPKPKEKKANKPVNNVQKSVTESATKKK
ncbi:hypothetical protein [Carnobacterium maltaromaticum]|uniref:hypothetical protein n=1 Tax=Carnobacterium maltaromaticum TaxID=2751 RepID=UPI0012F82EDF|nr:hypothetical protein [Carnobacterium maltaromaticum]